MGVQDFDPDVQVAINRIQTSQQTRELLDHARSVGFRGLNVDLIYGLPLQTAERWKQTMDQVMELAPDRAAVYAFAWVPDVKPHQKKLATLQIPSGANKLELFQITYDAFLSAGYKPIGMDHFAKPDDELVRAQERRALTRNFQGYTVKAATDVIAIGATGISDVGGLYAQNERVLPRYEKAVLSGQLPVARGFALSEDDRRRRAIIQQVMCNFYVDLGATAEASFGPELKRLREFEREGMLTVRGGEIELTPLGRVFVRNVAAVFDAYLGKEQVAFSRAV
jgi:oxygen-independent coproporphyrinogen III oxidase